MCIQPKNQSDIKTKSPRKTCGLICFDRSLINVRCFFFNGLLSYKGSFIIIVGNGGVLRGSISPFPTNHPKP